MPRVEMEGFFKKHFVKGRHTLEQCPDTGRYLARVFQHDDVLLGNCYWVCRKCLSNKMGLSQYLPVEKRKRPTSDEGELE